MVRKPGDAAPKNADPTTNNDAATAMSRHAAKEKEEGKSASKRKSMGDSTGGGSGANSSSASTSDSSGGIDGSYDSSIASSGTGTELSAEESILGAPVPTWEAKNLLETGV